MLSFAWLFVHRFGVSAYLRHLFVGISVLALMIAAAAFVAPELVFAGTRLRGELIADTGTVAALGLVFCLSNVPSLGLGCPGEWCSSSGVAGSPCHRQRVAFVAAVYLGPSRLHVREKSPSPKACATACNVVARASSARCVFTGKQVHDSRWREHRDDE